MTNIALEGIMLTGAFGTTIGTYYTGNPFAGIICGITFGLLTALIHAIVSINIKADQIVSGIAINLFAVGITKFILEMSFHSSSKFGQDRRPSYNKCPLYPWFAGSCASSREPAAALHDFHCNR